jgi:hypothetical protein
MIIPRRKTDHVIDRGMRILYKDEEGEHKIYEGELKIAPYTLEQKAASISSNKIVYMVVFDALEGAEAFRKYLKYLEDHCTGDIIL